MVDVDNRLADLSDAMLDFFWEWCGVERRTVAKTLLILSTLLNFQLSVIRHRWWLVLMDGILFALYFEHAERGIDTSPGIVEKTLRLLFVSLCLAYWVMIAALFWLRNCGSYECFKAIAFTLLVWFLYVIYKRGGGSKREKKRRQSISEVLKRFGTGWIPEPREGSV